MGNYEKPQDEKQPSNSYFAHAQFLLSARKLLWSL